MLRVLLAIGGTIAGLVALLSFKSHSEVVVPDVAASTGPSATAPAPTSTSPGPAASGPATQPSRTPAPAHPATSPAAAPQVLTGKVFETKFGPMQVQVTLDGHKIVKVTVLQQTDLGSLSPEIDARAIPELNQETLTAQSGKIDAVSGASYTSAGYIESLQSALDQA
jgi:uncharacterized protein with FMN-binding domain